MAIKASRLVRISHIVQASVLTNAANIILTMSKKIPSGKMMICISAIDKKPKSHIKNTVMANPSRSITHSRK